MPKKKTAYCLFTCRETFVTPGWTSDPFVLDSALMSDLFSLWAALTVLASFFATGGCQTHTVTSKTLSSSFLHLGETTMRCLRAACSSNGSILSTFNMRFDTKMPCFSVFLILIVTCKSWRGSEGNSKETLKQMTKKKGMKFKWNNASNRIKH